MKLKLARAPRRKYGREKNICEKVAKPGDKTEVPAGTQEQIRIAPDRRSLPGTRMGKNQKRTSRNMQRSIWQNTKTSETMDYRRNLENC